MVVAAEAGGAVATQQVVLKAHGSVTEMCSGGVEEGDMGRRGVARGPWVELLAWMTVASCWGDVEAG